MTPSTAHCGPLWNSTSWFLSRTSPCPPGPQAPASWLCTLEAQTLPPALCSLQPPPPPVSLSLTVHSALAFVGSRRTNFFLVISALCSVVLPQPSPPPGLCPRAIPLPGVPPLPSPLLSHLPMTLPSRLMDPGEDTEGDWSLPLGMTSADERQAHRHGLQ